MADSRPPHHYKLRRILRYDSTAATLMYIRFITILFAEPPQTYTLCYVSFNKEAGT